MFVCACAFAYAQTDTIRYVSPNGAYNNDGRSWANAKNRVQDAINDLHEYLEKNYLTSGSVYIAAGTYVPTESTESSGGSMLNTSFKIYAGIHVYGGFDPVHPEDKPGDRIMANGKKVSENWADQSGTGTISGSDIASQWDLKHKTILTGNHSSTPPTFVFDSIRGRYSTTYPASSYHVVWFATTEKYASSDDALKDHFKPLAHPASIDGCVISSGNASSRSTTVREHTAYGGGVYMVGNSSMRACIVERCNATMRGGGIYCDGGGDIKFCYVHTCQSPGVGVVEGYGGGVCIDFNGSLCHSHITSCAARCGGGLMLSHVAGEYPTTGVEAIDTLSNYNPYTVSSVINNNTANAEGGGIYLAEGGTVNHATVCGNNCSGPDVTYYGRRHGRTGGIYVRNCGMIFNSVFWGNRCDANNDIQFASVRQKTGAAAVGFEIFAYHTAFMNHDITDWTGVTKEAVFSLNNHNLPVKGSSTNYPCFFRPTVDPTNWDSVNNEAGIYGAGVMMHFRPVDYPGPRIWHISSYSALNRKGVQVTESMTGVSYWLKHANSPYGVVSNPYDPVSTLGALVRRVDPIRYALVAPQGQEGRISSTPIPTVFIDPSTAGHFDENDKFIEPDYVGNSWDNPIQILGDAMTYFRTYLVEQPNNPIGSRAKYHLPSAWDEEGNITAYTDYDYVQILVKEGQLSTAGNGNYLGKEARTASIRVLSHMRLYGSYPAGLTGTSTAGRDPYEYITRITANIMSLTGEGFNLDNNTAHVVTFGNSEYAIVDGFKLADGNAHNLSTTQAVEAGGGVLVSNRTTADAKRIDMVGNELRNSIISNCVAPRGAAVYVDGEFFWRQGFLRDICYAELKMTNCVVRNNTVDFTHASQENGVVVANGRAFLEVNHCDVVNNVGHPFKSNNYNSTTKLQDLAYNGYVRVDNSLIFCNGETVLDHRKDLDGQVVLSVPDDATQDYVFGTYNMFDADIASHQSDATKPYGFFKSDYLIPDITGVLPSGYPSAANHLLTLSKTTLPADKHNQAIFTRSDPSLTSYPTFINPVRNVGHSAGGDKALYGGRVFLRPTNANPCVNAASTMLYDGTNIPRTDIEDYEMTDSLRRDFGGHPDIGAIENISLPRKGAAIYVTPNGAGKRDGSSWGNAIAGNTVYQISSVAGPELATGDQIDAEETCDRVLDSEGNPILTTDPKYNGGWGRVYFTSYKTGGISTTTVTRTWTTETIEYEGGPLNGQTQTPQDDVMSYDSVTVVGSTPSEEPGFEPRWMFDPRYPYGEISGASRSFWRANPYTGSYGSTGDFISACNANGWINNTRAERYVGGLQYAVEKASAANKTNHNDSVQVWVGAGQYTDYKGFIMRDSVTVYGGFPTTKYAAPGLAERQALMSDVVNIPKSLPAKDFEPSDYESVLQISNVNPDSTHLFKKSAVKYWDNDLTYTSSTDTKSYAYNNRTIVRHKRFEERLTDSTNVEKKYMTMPLFDTLPNPAEPDSISNDTVYFSFGAETAKDKWHLTLPIVDFDTVGGVLRWWDPHKDHAYGGTQWKNIKAAIQGTDQRDIFTWNGTTWTNSSKKTTKNHLWLRDIPWINANLWQTMKNVPAGRYRFKIDMSAFYRNDNTNTNTGVTLSIKDAQGTPVVSQILYHPARAQVRHYEFVFDQPEDGDLEIRVSMDDASGTTKCNRREIIIADISLKKYTVVTDYNEYETEDETVPKDVEDPLPLVVSTQESYAVSKSRTTIRKRVLTMPDVCVPTYGGGGIGDPVSMDKSFGDNLAHTDRVKSDSKDKRTATTQTKQEDPAYVEYNEANWDGFTIRHGFLYDESMAHGGGAGVNMYEGAHLRNCIVINNLSGSRNMKGGGIFCDGATSTIEGCFVLNNTSTYGTYKDKQKQIFAGGMFMYEGTCFNSLFANNYSNGSAGGVGFCVGRFFNNTIAYNTCDLEEGGHKNGGAISIATSSNPNLFVANTVIYGNEGMAIRERYDTEIKMNQINPFINCYVQNTVAFTQDLYKKNIGNHSDNAANFGVNNILLDGVAPSAQNTPFAADFVEGVYTPGNASANNDFQLRNLAELDSSCVNHGTEDFAGVFYDALSYKGNSDEAIKKMFIYKSVKDTKIPPYDVAFAKRVQDCQIDIGAYEYNAAYNIMPDTTTHPGQAIFYVTLTPTGGDASASSPANAACKQKIQHILDAAGRYKYALMTESRYDKGTAGTYVSDQPNKHWSVEVWLNGDSVGSTMFDEPTDYYTPTRSTKHSIPNYNDNTIDYSFIIPHGIKVIGGWEAWFFHYEDAEGHTVAAGTEGAHVVDDRDPLTFRTVLSGNIESSTGAQGQTYHIVTFTNDLFSPDDEKIMGDGNQLAVLTEEKDRAVLDGLFLTDGKANGPDEDTKIGGACVVTDYAHIRNCVIQNNTADEFGGGLYLKPRALVSGTIVKNNTANTGGGIYVEKPTKSQIAADSLAHVFYTTICENTGRSSAGGLFFDNTYARINSSAIWHNNANDNANVAGNFARSSEDIPYPMNFCAVESRRLEGQGNIELSPRETEGVRWDRQDPFDAIFYYPIEMSSTLSRAGLSYAEWDSAHVKFATLDSIDIAGVSRKRWTSDGSERGYAWGSDILVTKNNDVIDIGARAVNKNFEVHVDARYVMHRLYVMHTDLIDSKAARALQDNTNTDDVSNMYRQMGSCILNPFHRLNDAFEYIIKARSMDKDRYRNTRFEIFVEQGIYYPFHDAYGRQGAVRMNTFLVPEAVLIVGGVDSRPADHKYGQEGFKSPFSTVHLIGDSTGGGVDVPIPGTEYTINFEYTDNIRLRDADHRPMRDNNLNSVIEPWELERQTILSGNAVAGEDFTHVYHVVTCHADERYVGPRPIKYGSINPTYGYPGHEDESILTEPLEEYEPSVWNQENDMSILARTIGFDGVQITGGYANHLDLSDTVGYPYATLTYFRGGGIYVDGNWHQMSGEKPDMTQPAAHNIPIVVENCYFTNNMAGNGGAIYSNGGIYAYGNRFTQNYSQGPMTKLDQQYIPWTAGGCIATNAFCGVSNTLFDNNEARRGLYPLKAESEDPIPNADARQGFGGCLSIADKSITRVVNCHFMKNKAVAYSAMYNFYPNNRYSDPDSMQFAFNTIFWGNEVFDVEHLTELEKGTEGWDGEDDAILAASSAAFDTNYKASRAGVFHYDGDEWDTYERLFSEYDALYKAHEASDSVFHPDVIAKLMELRAQGNKIEGLYFCSYRKTYGPSGMKPTRDGYLLTGKECREWQDPRSRNTKTKKTDNNDTVEDYTDLWTHVAGNNNTLINRINTATDGPNFKQPTFVAGIDGYMQNADWLQARMNLTTDQGWGYLKQSVERGVSYYITKYTGTEQFETEDEALEAAQAAHPGATKADVFAIKGLPVASFKPSGQQPSPGAMYNFLAWRYGRMMSETNAPLPLRDQYYMTYTRSTSDSEMSGNMDRISKNPKMDIEDVYIDLGVYEYQYVQLDIKGQEIDTVWVATKAKDPLKQDGLTWETPTTDMQYAIDLLMSSHNNHDKYVCLMGDGDGGTVSPQDVIDNRRAFVITSNSRSPLLPDSAMADFDYGVNSLTFLGGYSHDVKDTRDPLATPTVIEMPHSGNESQLNQLFIVEDMTRQMVQANFVGDYTSRDSVVIPIVFDGITFINPYSVKEPDPSAYSSLGGQMSKKGGAAIYYRWQRRYEDDGTQTGTPNFHMALHPDSALIDGNKVTLPKLTISNCIFMDNGARTVNKLERSPAVRIDHGGGSSLIVNTLFHSNAGAPIYARTYDYDPEENDLARVPNDVVMINVTSALNDEHIRLESENSEMHNSLIWLDDLKNDTLIQLQMGEDQWDKTTNKDRAGIDGRMTHNAVWGCFQVAEWGADKSTGDPYKNHPLATDNNDVYKGPGFFSPHVNATTEEQRRERSFRLNPSIRTMNMADSTLYKNRVFFRQYPNLDEGSPHWRRSNGFKDETVTYATQDYDLATNLRSSNGGMERGAYECLVTLQRVLYVRPERPKYDAGDGSSWEKAFGQEQLQNAIDAAAVYTYMNQDKPREDRKAYVFVKGTGTSTIKYNLEARDGVYVYGSLTGSFNDTAWIDTEKKAFTNEECRRFKNYVRASRAGIATSNAQTKINSIHITGDDFKTGFLLDGFVITNPDADLTTSPILIDNDSAVIRNCVIVDNHVTDAEHPIANVKHGLLYNCLFYNDTAQTIVKVGENGLVLNNTIVANNNDVTPLDDSEAASGAVVNNISGQLTNLTCFAPYMTEHNPYTLPTYLTNSAPLAFQLHEHSTYINSGTMDSALPDLFDTYIQDSIILFKWDRDILGNPRKISTSVDMGAFETWYVAKNYGQEISTLTDMTPHTSTAPHERDTAYTKNYGGHNYPHPGSVVYLMDSAIMTMQYETSGDFKDFDNQDVVFSPGFMLLKPGASFYGNGHKAQIGYVAAEKKLSDQQYAMTSFPYNYNTGNITVSSYDAEKDSLNVKLSTLNFTTYRYNGIARSDKDYIFQPRNSTLWTQIDATDRTATDGYLLDFGTAKDTVLRFNAFAPAVNQYVYTEDGTNKTITLTQHDNRTPGSGSTLNFTRQEDMGWNMKGLPWLVSDYRTDTLLDEDGYIRQMHIPHVLYMMDGAGEYLKAGGQVYSARSWDQPTYLSMGSAFLTQTATTQDSETVTFYQPYYARNDKKPARPFLLMSTAGRRGDHTDLLTLYADSTASADIQYTYGRDAIKWDTNDSTPQVYLLDSKRLSRLSLLGAAPTEVDIPLGVYLPLTANPSPITFTLPEKEAFEGFDYVWFIDYQRNRYTNLLDEDYEIELGGGEHHHRFAIRIGGYPKGDKNGERRYIVYTSDGNLYVGGIIPGDRIAVYTPTGMLVHSTIANANEFILPLFHQSGFLVRVNDSAHKVVNW